MKRIIYQWALRFILKQHSLWLSSDGYDGIMLDLSGENLTEARFDGASIGGASFNKAILRGSSFAEANLVGSVFLNSVMQKCAFFQTDLSFSDMGAAILRKVAFNMAGRIPQIQELDSIKSRARDLWRVVDSLNYKARMTDKDLSQQLELEAADLEWFLKEYDIPRKHHLGKN